DVDAALGKLQPAKGFKLGHAHGFSDSPQDPGLLHLIQEDSWKGPTVLDLAENDDIRAGKLVIESAAAVHYLPAKTAKPLSAVVSVNKDGHAFLDLTKVFEGTPFADGGPLAGKFKLNDPCCEIIYAISREGKNKGVPFLLPSLQKGYIMK